ncbi:MAG TPA: hypothetical protein VKC89_00590 [Patescibacteria group bacterium]|nr:hypothetical protein [Patescibacteria group bacterium]
MATERDIGEHGAEKTSKPKYAPIEQFDKKKTFDLLKLYWSNRKTLEPGKPNDPDKPKHVIPLAGAVENARLSGVFEIQDWFLEILGQEELIGETEPDLQLSDVDKLEPQEINKYQLVAIVDRYVDQRFTFVARGITKSISEGRKMGLDDEKIFGRVRELRTILENLGQTQVADWVDNEIEPPKPQIDWAGRRSEGHGGETQ